MAKKQGHYVPETSQNTLESFAKILHKILQYFTWSLQVISHQFDPHLSHSKPSQVPGLASISF